jgi:hypothetical protein
MTYVEKHAPKRWLELCAKLRTETDPDKFKALLAEIDHVLRVSETSKSARKLRSHSTGLLQPPEPISETTNDR